MWAFAARPTVIGPFVPRHGTPNTARLLEQRWCCWVSRSSALEFELYAAVGVAMALILVL